MNRPVNRDEHIADSADSKTPDAARTMTESERLEAEAKGRRTATDAKTSGEKLKDVYPGR